LIFKLMDLFHLGARLFVRALGPSPSFRTRNTNFFFFFLLYRAPKQFPFFCLSTPPPFFLLLPVKIDWSFFTSVSPSQRLVNSGPLFVRFFPVEKSFSPPFVPHRPLLFYAVPPPSLSSLCLLGEPSPPAAPHF